MLFDLRSRGRRRTVQVVYIGLAILIGAGLVLFGVGTGTGGGGLFGGLTGDSSSHSNSALNAQTKQALAATKKTPDSASAWSSLVSARFSAANSNGTVNNETGVTTYSSTGTNQLNLLVSAYRHYLTLTHSPDATTATIAGKAYSSLNQYSNGAIAYQAVLQTQPDDLTATECVALLSYAAGNDGLAEVAQSRALAKLPKSARKSTATQLEAAKTDKSAASQYCGG